MIVEKTRETHPQDGDPIKTQRTQPKKGEPIEIPIPSKVQIMGDFEKIAAASEDDDED